MNPNMQSQQPQGPQQDMMSGPTQNPFTGILQQMKGGMMGGQPGQPQDEGGAEGAPDMETGTGEPVNQLLPGQTADNTQGLIGALSSMQKYISDATNPQEIVIARQIASLLTQLIAREHQKGLGNLSRDQVALPAHQQMLKQAAVAKRILK